MPFNFFQTKAIMASTVALLIVNSKSEITMAEISFKILETINLHLPHRAKALIHSIFYSNRIR
jgi:hypothetical protein